MGPPPVPFHVSEKQLVRILQFCLDVILLRSGSIRDAARNPHIEIHMRTCEISPHRHRIP